MDRVNYNNLANLAIGAVVIYGIVRIIGVVKDVTDFDGQENLPSETPVDIENLSFPIFLYDQYADALEQLFWGNFPFGPSDDDQQAIVDILSEMNNLDDLSALLNAFGLRCYPAWLCESLDSLTSAVQQNLDLDFKISLNENYLEKLIPYVWP